MSFVSADTGAKQLRTPRALAQSSWRGRIGARPDSLPTSHCEPNGCCHSSAEVNTDQFFENHSTVSDDMSLAPRAANRPEQLG
jgi:hypothetical protein